MSATAQSSKFNIALNAAASWAGHAAQLVVAFFLCPVLVRALGDGRYGVWSLVEAVLAYLMLFDLGLGAAVLRYVSKFDESRDWERLNRVFNTSLAAFAGAGLIAGTIAMVMAFGWERPLGVPEGMASDTRWLLVLLGTNLALGLPLGLFPTVLQGLGRYPTVAGLHTLSMLGRSAGILVAIYLGGGLVSVGCVVLVANLTEHLTAAVLVRRAMPQLRMGLGYCTLATLREIGSYSYQAFLALVAGRMSFQTDSIIIAMFLAPAAITYFAIAARLVEYAKSSFWSLITVLTPAISALDARNDRAGIRRMLIDVTRMILYAVLPVGAGFWFMGRAFLTIWIGAEYAEQSFTTLAILATALPLAVAQGVSARILYGTGRLEFFWRLVLAEAFANLLLSLALAPRWGIEGVAFGTMLPNLVSNLVLAVYICRFVQMSFTSYLWQIGFRPSCAVVLPAMIWAIVGRQPWAAASWANWLTAGFLGGVPYAMLVLLIEPALRKRLLGAWAKLRTRIRSLGEASAPVVHAETTKGRVAPAPVDPMIAKAEVTTPS